VSILRLPGDVIRVACNRDEQITRAPASPPVIRRFGERRAVLPVDPVSNGTWIAANDAGVVLTLLNYTRRGDARPQAPLSRGLIIPRLLNHSTADDAASATIELDASSFSLFRLIAVDHATLIEVVSDGVEIRIHAHEHRPASMFTSSGLGDHLVDAPRRALFERFVTSHGVSSAMQDAFHTHQWPGQPHLGVRMQRADARTVSSTVVEVGPARVAMSYRAFEPSCSHRILLPRRLTTCCSSH
jgi:hypothetical protein